MSSKKEPVVLGGGEQAVLPAQRIGLPCPSSLLWEKDGHWVGKCGLERKDRYRVLEQVWRRTISASPHLDVVGSIYKEEHCSLFLPLCKKWGMHGRGASPGTGGWGLISLRLLKMKVEGWMGKSRAKPHAGPGLA